jgi:hypothetical protein
MHRTYANAWYPNTGGGNHTTFPQPEGFAWSEGWATFYTQVVANDGWYLTWGNLEDRASVIRSDITDDVNEWRVAQAMTDLFDANIDGDDYAQIPYIRFINTMQSNNSNSLSEFWSQLRNSLSGNDRWLGYRSLTYNTIVVPFEPAPPVISGFTQTPVPIYRGQSGAVTCNLSQGSGNISYEWTARYVPSGVYVSFSGNRATIAYGSVRPAMRTALLNGSDGGGNDPMGEFHLTCTASNAAGTSTGDFYPILVSDPPPPPPGCPFVYAWTDSAYVADNNILPQSQLPENEGRDVTDYYQMFVPPTLSEDKYILAVGEFENEHSFLDQIKLLVVDHDPGVFITVDDSGTVIQFAKPAVFADARLDSTDVLQYLRKLDGVKVEATENDTMRLWFTRDGGSYEEGILLVGQVARKEAIAGRITSRDKQQRVTFTNFRLRRNMSYTWILVPAADTSTVQIDIEWKQDAAVDYSELSRKLDLPFTLQEATLITAEHSTAGDVTENLLTWDENYAELMPEEWIRLEFQAPPPTQGLQRSFVLVSRGRYEPMELSPSSSPKSTPPAGQPSASVHSPIPATYDIGQNFPNPFNPAAMIKYQLPEDGHVSLKVYDITGRLVATLVDETQRAGYYEVRFDATSLASGVYLYRMTASKYVATRKFVVVK